MTKELRGTGWGFRKKKVLEPLRDQQLPTGKEWDYLSPKLGEYFYQASPVLGPLPLRCHCC